MALMTMREALNQAIRERCSARSVFLMGEVAAYQGAYKVQRIAAGVR